VRKGGPSGVLFAMWRDGTDYDATRAAKVIPANPSAPRSKRGRAPLSPLRVCGAGLTVASNVAAQFVF